MVDAQEIITGAEDVAKVTADLAAHDPSVLARIDAYLKEKEAELVANLTAKYGAAPEVKPVPVVSETKSQADVIAEMQATIQALKAQVEESKKPASPSEPVVMEGGTPVPHNLLLDDGSWVLNHPGLATHYSVTVPATATEDEHDTVKKVVAAYPA